MKIMIAVKSYYPANNGIQNVTQYIAEGIKKDNEILILTNLEEGMDREDEHNGIQIERIIAKRNIFHRFYGEKRYYLDRIKSYKPDVLMCVCTQDWPFDWIRKSLHKIDCIKILYTHGYSECRKKNRMWEYLGQGKYGKAINEVLYSNYYRTAHKYIAKFDLVTYLSENDISVWYALKHRLTNGFVLGNAIDDRFFQAEYECGKKSEKDGIIRYIYIAMYSKTKGQEMVLDAFYKANVPNSELIFCGQDNNDYMEMLQNKKNDLDNQLGYEKKVSFLYKQDRETIISLYKTSDVFVCGSWVEAYSISLCEAAASKLAVISTDVGNAQNVPGVWIVNTVDEMAKAIETLYNDVSERENRAQLLRKYAEENCKIEDKVNWMNMQIQRLIEERHKKGEKCE